MHPGIGHGRGLNKPPVLYKYNGVIDTLLCSASSRWCWWTCPALDGGP